jgi:5,5'-dehydrodivanillate O-demethylase
VEQPGEDGSNAAKVRIRSYPTKEYLGHIFAYLGEGESPPLRRFPDFDRPGVVEASTPEIWPCNYFSRIENDPNHVPFVHRESLVRAGRTERLLPRKVSAEETEYGVRMGMSVPGEPPAYLHFHMPNVIQSRSRVRVEGSLEDVNTLWADRYLMHVPIDDERNVTFIADWIPVTGKEAERYRERRLQARETMRSSPNDIGEAILAGKTRIEDLDKETPTYYSFWVEDYVSLVGQGPIADRANERLIHADIGVVFIRKVWERELRALAEGLPLKQWRTPPGLADQSVVEEPQQIST